MRDNIEIKGGNVILLVSKLSKKYEPSNFSSFAFFYEIELSLRMVTSKTICRIELLFRNFNVAGSMYGNKFSRAKKCFLQRWKLQTSSYFDNFLKIECSIPKSTSRKNLCARDKSSRL